MIVTVPSASKWMPPISLPGGAVPSRYCPTPRPRSLPRARLSALARAANPSQSASRKRPVQDGGEIAAVVGLPDAALYGISPGERG